MSAYVVFTHILWRRRVIKDSIGVESLVNHMRPDPGRPFMRLPPFNPAAVSVVYTFLRFAAHGFGDFCRAHPFFTQGDDAGSVEGDGSAHDCDENRKAGSDSRHAHRPTDGVLPVRLAYEP
jgi:hypothetical protein